MQPNPRDIKCSTSSPLHSDVVVCGAGLIGLSLALELHDRGASVTVIERGRALDHASIAAAGMLAVDDPHNPSALHPLSQLSISLYPAFLEHIASLSGADVPFHTKTTLQHLADGSIQKLGEHSLDPRQLASALLQAIRSTTIRLIEGDTIASTEEAPSGLRLSTTNGAVLSAGHLVFSSGAWTPHFVTPRKGQMLRVQLPTALNVVHRSEQVYIVPRTAGPQAGTAIIGATVEDAGFDTTVHVDALSRLRSMATELLPWLANDSSAPTIESWAGLRPATPDSLPLLGCLRGNRQLIASGHFRNGILLAPATAVVIADILDKGEARIDLTPFAPDRFTSTAE